MLRVGLINGREKSTNRETFFRKMGTRAAAFSAKIKSLRELQAKVNN
jgi:hypothetical protein